MRDLVPVALPFNLSYSLVGSKQSPYATPKQVIDAAKANPGKLTLANAGRGTGQHILGAAFMKVTRHADAGGALPGFDRCLS
jgi:tripartite-type tricarboxylate transporter receptor subunit TctC